MLVEIERSAAAELAFVSGHRCKPLNLYLRNEAGYRGQADCA